MAIPDAKFLGLRSIDFERCELSDEREDHAQRHRHQAGQADRRLSLVRRQEAVAKRDREDAQQRLQAGSRIADLQGHQLRDRDVRAGAAGGAGLAGLSWLSVVSCQLPIVSGHSSVQFLKQQCPKGASSSSPGLAAPAAYPGIG